MGGILASLLRALAPALIQEARAFLHSDEGRKFVSDAKALALDAIKAELATAEPLHTDDYLAGKPGVGIDGNPL